MLRTRSEGFSGIVGGGQSSPHPIPDLFSLGCVKSINKIIWIGLLVIIAGCKGAPQALAPTTTVEEVEVVSIPLAGPVSKRAAEISGLAWYGDTLIILPQYPALFPTEIAGSLFAIPKDEILDYLKGVSVDAIVPQVIPFDDAGLSETIAGFEGFEAIGFSGEQVFMTIESETKAGMTGFLVTGEIQSDLNGLSIDGGSFQEIHPQADLENFSDESILVLADILFTFYEANGANINAQPVGHGFDFDLQPVHEVSFPVIEYRITDLTMPDAEGRFWAINYHFSGDTNKMNLAEDEIAIKHGQGASHARSKHVERLVEFYYASDGIILTTRPPIQLQLLENGKARNWEGIVRLDELGFLLMSDKHPGTILGFVPIP